MLSTTSVASGRTFAADAVPLQLHALELLQRGVIGEPFGSQVVRAFADRPEVSGRGVVCHRRSVSEEETRQRAVQPTIGGSVYVKPQEIVIA